MPKQVNNVVQLPLPRTADLEAAMLRHPAGGVGVSSATYRSSNLTEPAPLRLVQTWPGDQIVLLEDLT